MPTPKTNLLKEVWEYFAVSLKYFWKKKAEPTLEEIKILLQKRKVKVLVGFLILLSFIPIILFVVAVITAYNSYDGFLAKQYFIWSFLFCVIPFTFVGFVLGAILKTVSTATKFFSALEGVVDLYYNPEHAKKTFHKFFLVLWWLMVAVIFCYLVPVNNNPVLLTLILLVTIFLIISTLAGVVTPDPEFYKKVWKMMVTALMVATLLLFIGPSGYKKSVRSLEKGFATEQKFRDQILQEKIERATEKMERAGKKGDQKDLNRWADSLRTYQDELAAKRKAKISLEKIRETGDSLLDKVRGRNNTKTIEDAGGQLVRATNKKIIYENKAFPVAITPTQLPIIPRRPMSFRFIVPDTTTSLVWEYEYGYGRKILTINNFDQKRLFIYNEKGSNPNNVPAFVSASKDITVELFITQ